MPSVNHPAPSYLAARGRPHSISSLAAFGAKGDATVAVSGNLRANNGERSANHCNRRSGSRLLADIYCCRRPAGTLVALDLIRRLSSSAFCPIANPAAKVRALSILPLTALQSGALDSVVLPPSQKSTYVLVAATIARRLELAPTDR